MTKVSPRALIIGASGQVGKNIYRLLSQTGAVPTSRVPRAGWKVIDLESIEKDGCETLLDEDFSAVYCVGGATDVDGCEKDIKKAFLVNASGPTFLAKTFRHVPFVYFSSDYVFDGADGPYLEIDETHPLSAYGQSKLRGEQQVLEAHPKAIVIRTTAVYGPDPRLRNFPSSIAIRMQQQRLVRVPADQFATPTYNQDLARVAVGLVQANASGIFNACGDELVSRYEWAVAVAKALGLDAERLIGCETSDLHQAAPRPMRGGLISDKLRATLPNASLRPVTRGVSDWAAADATLLEKYSAPGD